MAAKLSLMPALAVHVYQTHVAERYNLKITPDIDAQFNAE